MGEDQGQDGAAVTSDEKTPDEIRREIEATREDLGETAAALAAKTDVKARAKEKVGDVKQTISQKKESLTSNGDGSSSAASAQASHVASQVKTTASENPIPVAAIAAFAGGFLIGRITRR